MLEGWAHLLGCRLPIGPSGHGAWEAGVCILDILLSTKYIATFFMCARHRPQQGGQDCFGWAWILAAHAQKRFGWLEVSMEDRSVNEDCYSACAGRSPVVSSQSPGFCSHVCSHQEAQEGTLLAQSPPSFDMPSPWPPGGLEQNVQMVAGGVWEQHSFTWAGAGGMG